MNRSLRRRLWIFVRPYRVALALTFLLGLLGTPLALLLPIPLKIAVDSVIGNRPLPSGITVPLGLLGLSPSSYALAAVAVALVLITFLIYLQGLAAWIAQTWLGEKLTLDLRAALFHHAQRLSLAYHDRT